MDQFISYNRCTFTWTPWIHKSFQNFVVIYQLHKSWARWTSAPQIMIHEPDGHQLQRVLLNPLAWIHKSHQNIFASIVDLIKWKDLNPWRNCSYKSFLCKEEKRTWPGKKLGYLWNIYFFLWIWMGNLNSIKNRIIQHWFVGGIA